jgi:hypothetical protein
LKSRAGDLARVDRVAQRHIDQSRAADVAAGGEAGHQRRARADAERNLLVELLGARIEAFNTGARQIGLTMPRYDSGFFVTVFTKDGQKTAATMRDLGVFVLPIPGAVRVALCATPLAEIPRLLDALEKGVAAAG